MSVDAAPLVEVHDVVVERGAFRVGTLDVELAPSRCTALVGPNGSGKSTLLLAVLGLIPTRSGTVSINGRSVDHRQPPSGVGAMLSWPGFYPWASGAHNLALAADGDPLALERSRSLIDEVGLAAAANKPVSDYSTGMAKRLELARALLFDPSVLVLDEPTNGLDAAGWIWLVEQLHGRMASGIAVLAATHDHELVEQVASGCIEVDAGSVGPRRSLG